MAKTATQIVEYAITLMDEQVTTFATAASTEMSLKEMGLEVLPQVCRELVQDLPWELKDLLADTEILSNITPSQTTVKQKVVFTLPSDFWELVAIKLEVWNKPVTEYIKIDSPEYFTQNNPFTRNGKQNPVVAIVPNLNVDAKSIECFSVNDGDAETVETFKYIKFDNVPNDSGNNWPDRLLDVTAKALVSQLGLIKNRLEQGAISGQEAGKLIQQHE